jgi:hypothetical protein
MFNHSNQFKMMMVATLVLGAACSEAQPGAEDSTRTLARLTASDAATRELNVAAWDVEEGDSGTFILGTSAAGQVVVKVQIQQPLDGSEERVEIIGLVPETGRLALTRDGRIEGDAPERLRQIATRLHAELGADGLGRRMPIPPRDGDVAEVASALNDRKIAYQANIDLGWSLFGYSFEVPMGGVCKDGFDRTTYGTTVYNGTGNCYFTGWASENSLDCTAVLHVGQRGWNSAKCIWTIYQNGNGY